MARPCTAPRCDTAQSIAKAKRGNAKHSRAKKSKVKYEKRGRKAVEYYDDTKPFSEQLKAARKAVGLTQLSLSQKLNIPKITIVQWETNQRTPSAWAAELLLKELDKLKPPID